MPSQIEWTDETWNPTVGCSQVSPGCDGCYAIGVAHRAMQPAHVGLTIKRPGEPIDWTGEVRCLPDRLDTPLHWRRPRRVFVDSMSDLFHPDVPVEFIRQVFDTMATASGHTFQVLTKRPQRMWKALKLIARYDGHVGHMGETMPLPNVWLGTSIESEKYLWRVGHLRSASAAVRFLSLEPLLGPLPGLDLTGIDWVIVGGESGPKARPMHPDWVRGIRDACLAAGVPFFFKQWGSWTPEWGALGIDYIEIQDGGGITMWADGRIYHGYGGSAVDGSEVLVKVGKKAAGRALDGRTWDEMP